MLKSIRKELAEIQVSGIRTFNNRVAEVPDMIRLTLGEPDFPTPEHIKKAGIRAIENNFTNYTLNAGTAELRTQAARYFNDKYQVRITAENLIVTVGATEAIAISLQTILEPGDEVILPDPVYPGYEPIIRLMKAKPVKIDTTQTNFKLTPSSLKAALSKRTKALILPYPSNPTGVSLSQTELKSLAGLLEGTGIYIVADEIYSELTYRFPHTSMYALLPHQTLTINGLSKSHAMIGWRIGFLMADKWLIQEMLKIHQYTVTCATSISQAAALEALTNGKEDSQFMCREYKKRAEFLKKHLIKMGFEIVSPNGAFYFFVKLPDFVRESSFEWAVRLAKEAKVAVIPGNAFSEKGDRYFRLSYAASFENLTEAMHRLSKFMEEI